MANNVSINVRATDRASSELDKIRNRFETLTTSKGFQRAAEGVGIGAGVAVWGTLAGAIQGIPDALMGAASAAAEDETSQAKLYEAVKRNSTGWDGNREAIEKVITKRMALGFSDEAQRDSLALLVTKTGDVTEALDIERASMDLARLKGIDLADATKAVSLGMSGSGRALKELGIKVGEHTSKWEVLREIQEKAGGQAEIYASTTQGAMGAANIAIGEAVETIGRELTPTIKELAFFVRDTAVPAVQALGVGLDILGAFASPVGDQMAYAREQIAAAAKAESDLALGWDTIAEKAAGAREPLAQGQRGIEDILPASALTREEIDKLADKFRDAARVARDHRLDEAWDIANLPDKIVVARADVAAAQQALEDARGSVARAEARIRLRDAQQELLDLQNALRDMEGDYGASGLRLARSLGVAMLSEIQAWNNLSVAELSRLGDVHINPRVNVGPRNIDVPGHADGGWVGLHGPEIIRVGERGREYITPNGGGGPSINLNVQVQGAAIFDPYGQAAQQIAGALLPGLQREVRRQGAGF